MNEKPNWTGIEPSPAALETLDYEEMATLALLCWSSASNQPVTAKDVAALKDRDGVALGIGEARDIVRHLGDLKIVSVFGMGNERPMSVRVGGFRPRMPRTAFTPDRRPATASTSVRTAPRKAPGPRKQTGTPPWVLKERRVETGLEITDTTPEYVRNIAAKLRARQVGIESGSHGDDLVGAAEARLDILMGRIALYEQWLLDEPKHPKLRAILDKKRKAVPEMKFQIERAKAKQVEADGESRAG